MTETFDLASVAYARWKRAVDLLVREVVARRRSRAAVEEETQQHARAEKGVRSLRRIVRKALSDYSRPQIGGQ